MSDFLSGLADVASVVATPVSAVVNAIQTGDNNRESRELAQRENAISRDFAREQSRFSSNEAAVAREFQREMANTAHQREVEDLRRAGLNPILSANQGAAVPVGSTGQAMGSSSQGIPKGDVPRLGDAFDTMASSARAQAQFRQGLANAKASEAVDKATVVAKASETDKNVATAKGQRLQNQILRTQMPAVAAQADKEAGQAGWDKWFQGFDNWLRRASDVGGTLLDFVNPVTSIKRGHAYDSMSGRGMEKWFQAGRDSVTGRSGKKTK